MNYTNFILNGKTNVSPAWLVLGPFELAKGLESKNSQSEKIDIAKIYKGKNNLKIKWLLSPGFNRGLTNKRGRVYTHCPHHAGHPKNPKKKSHPGIHGHNWYMGIVYEYLLTGDERLLDCVKTHGEAILARIDFLLTKEHVLSRSLAWPMKNLCAIYQITEDKRYLEAAARCMNYWHWWKKCVGAGCMGGAVYQNSIIISSVKDYYDITRDPDAKRTFLEMIDDQLEGMLNHKPAGEKLPAECLFHSDHRSYMLLDVLSYAYWFTGDKKYIADYVDYLYFFLSVCDDPTMLWCTPSFLEAMKFLDIKEPIKRLPMPLPLYSKIKKAIVKEKKDRDFTITILREQPFRNLYLGYVSKHGKDRNAQKKKRKKYLSADNYGIIRITSPSQKVISETKIEKYYSKYHTVKIPKDGETGIYTVELIADDPFAQNFPRCRFFVDTSLKKIMLNVTKKAFYDRSQSQSFYFLSNTEKPFRVELQSRKEEHMGAAQLLSKNKNVVDFVCWDENNSKKWHSLKAKGKGVWNMIRYTPGRAEYLKLKGIQPYISKDPNSLFYLENKK